MAHSKDSICNAALRILGKGALVVDSDSDAPQEYDLAADAVAAYDQRIGRLLRSHDWAFATVRAALEQDATAPAYKYAYRYRLPPDCAKFWELDRDQVGDNADYAIEGNFILINQSGPLNVRYVKRETDPTTFTDDFAEALAGEIARKIAVKALGSLEAADFFRKESKEETSDARTMDSQEKPPKAEDEGTWLRGRTSG